MIDFLIGNIIPISIGVSASMIVYRKRFGYKAKTVFKTTDYKRKFKKHQIAFNREFEKTNNLFK